MELDLPNQEQNLSGLRDLINNCLSNPNMVKLYLIQLMQSTIISKDIIAAYNRFKYLIITRVYFSKFLLVVLGPEGPSVCEKE